MFHATPYLPQFTITFLCMKNVEDLPAPQYDNKISKLIFFLCFCLCLQYSLRSSYQRKVYCLFNFELKMLRKEACPIPWTDLKLQFFDCRIKRIWSRYIKSNVTELTCGLCNKPNHVIVVIVIIIIVMWGESFYYWWREKLVWSSSVTV